VPLFCLKKKKSNMFGVEASMEGGVNMITWTTPTPLDDYLWGAYSGILLEYSEQNSLKISWKILKNFITILCYGLHKILLQIYHF
jgi:hypothetical protein